MNVCMGSTWGGLEAGLAAHGGGGGGGGGAAQVVPGGDVVELRPAAAAGLALVVARVVEGGVEEAHRGPTLRPQPRVHQRNEGCEHRRRGLRMKGQVRSGQHGNQGKARPTEVP